MRNCVDVLAAKMNKCMYKFKHTSMDRLIRKIGVTCVHMHLDAWSAYALNPKQVYTCIDMQINRCEATCMNLGNDANMYACPGETYF